MEIKSYAVSLLGGRELNYDDLGKCSTTAQLKLIGEKTQAYLVFYDPEKTSQVPKNRYANPEGKRPVVFLPRDQYIAHLDLLRNEQPVHLIETGGQKKSGTLWAGSEDVGDGD